MQQGRRLQKGIKLFSPLGCYRDVYPKRSFNSSDKARHSFLRRLFNPSFSPSALKALEITMNAYFEEFITGIERRSIDDGIVEMNEWFHNLTFDV
jgi:cytochrome P450